MKSPTVSDHLARVVKYVRDQGGWVTTKDISDATGIAHRTARSHAARMVKEELFEQANAFPGYLYRYTERNPTLAKHIENISGIKKSS